LKKQDQLVDHQADRVHKERKEMETDQHAKEPPPEPEPVAEAPQQYNQYQQPPPQQQQQQQVPVIFYLHSNYFNCRNFNLI